MASIITGITVPDNTDPRGQNIIQSANITRDSGDPNSADVVRSKPPTTNQNPQQFSLGDTGVPTIQNTQPFFLGGADTVAISKEDVSKMVVDAIRNTSINGVYPTVTGGSIDFSLPTSTASEQWSQQNWSVIDSNLEIVNSKNASLGSSAQGVNSGNLSLMGSNLQIANSKNAFLDGNTQIVNSRFVPSIESNTQIAGSKTANLNSGFEVVNARVIPSIDSKSQIVTSQSVPLISSSSQISNSRSLPPIESNSQISNSRSLPQIPSSSQITASRSVPLIPSSSQITASRSVPLIDSKAQVANSKSSPLTDGDRRVANPLSNSLSRRRSNEQALDVNAVTPLYVKSADGKSAMVLYIQDSHTISIDPDTTIGDTIKDSMKGEDIGPSQYFLSGEGGAGSQFPFKISVKSGKDPKYKVAYNSSIINGTNGGPFAISGLNTEKSITSEKFIVAEASVTSNPFKVSDAGFTIKEVGSNDTDEVKIEDGKQTKIRLLIGKITVENLPNNGGKLIRPWQAVTTSFRTAVSFHNGVPVYILQVAPTHQSRI